MTLLVLLALAWLALPIWAALSAVSARKRAQELQGELVAARHLERVVARLEGAMKQLLDRVGVLEKQLAPSQASPLPAPEEGAVQSEPLPAVELSHPLPPPLVQATPTLPPPPPPKPNVPPPPSEPRMDWERWISVRGFAWLGGIALFLAAAFFLQHAIQHDLISETARVAIGLIVGLVALAGGEILRPKAGWAGQSTSGAGVAILYASVYAAHNLYGLIPLPTAFLAMVLVTVAAGAMALRRGVFTVAVLGTLGGFLTPYLLPAAGDRSLQLFLYVLLLDAGVILVARKRLWVSLPVLALTGTICLYATWAVRFLRPGNLPAALAAALVLGSLFLFGQARAVPDREKERVVRGVVFAALGALHLLAAFVAASGGLGISPVLLVAYLLIAAAITRRIGQLWDVAELMALSAAFAILALTLRIRPDLIPGRATETFAVFSLIGVAFFVEWFRRGRAESEDSSSAVAIAVGGYVAVLLRIVLAGDAMASLPECLAYAGLHTGLLIVMGVLRSSGAWTLAAHASLFAALAALALPFSDGRLAPLLVPIVVSGLFFWSLPFLSARFRSDRFSWFSSALAPLLHYLLLYILARPHWGRRNLGLVAALIAAGGVFALLLARRWLADPHERRDVLTLLGGVAVLFAVIAVPLSLENEWVPIVWAVEAAVLAWLGARVAHAGLSQASALLAAIVMALLLYTPGGWTYHPRSGTPVLNWYLYTFGAPAVTFLLAARWASRDPHAVSFRYPQGLRAAAGLLSFVLLNVEIADIYSKGPSLEFRIFGGGLAQDMTYSIAWGVFGLVLLVVGLAYRSRGVRAAALAVVVLTVGKVFLHDLWSLGALYRVGSIVGLAISLLAVSFLTQRFVFSKERS